MRVVKAPDARARMVARRRVAIVALTVAALLLGGCTAKQGQRPAGSADSSEPSSSAQTTEAAVEQTSVVSGAVVHMANGVTLTVPKGWRATLTRDTGTPPGLRGALGAAGASELLVLERLRSMLRIRLSSSPDEQIAGLAKVGYHPVVASAEATVFELPAGPARAAPSLSVVSMHVPGREFGLMVFPHTVGGTAATVEAIWRLLRIDGIAVPVRPVVGP